jgi:hypothetical protein
LEITGKDLRDKLLSINLPLELLNEFDIGRNTLLKFSKEHEDDIEKIRIKIGAHKKNEFIQFSSYLGRLNYINKVEVVLEFNDLVNCIGDNMLEINEYLMKYANEKYND